VNFAIIVEKNLNGSAKTLRSTVQPPPKKLTSQAKSLDSYLGKRIPEFEQKLIDKGLLDQVVPNSDSKKPVGNVSLWYAVGAELRQICADHKISGRRERRWLWDAIENLYASERIKRARRGRTRLHFEYCFRLSQLPRKIAIRLNWSEWVYFFDSPTVREDDRADKWLMRTATKAANIDRRLFRRFTENLNKRIRRKDTSVLSTAELYKLYDQAWKATKRELKATAERAK
jgi:hypothetical protein